MNEDTDAIARATYDAVESYADKAGPVSVSSLVQEYGGMSGLARELAGLGSGKLPAKGTAERRAYDNAQKSVSRWLAYESGSGKQARNPNTKATQEKLRGMLSKKPLAMSNPPSGMSITITGYIGYDDDYRYRTIDVMLTGSQVSQFLTHMQDGKTGEAYQDVMEAYNVGRDFLYVEANPDVSIDFSE